MSTNEMESLARQFPDGSRLRQHAAFQRELSNEFFDKGDDECGERFQELAEQALRKSLSLVNSFEAHISLAEILIDENEHLDEVIDQLLQAKAMVTDPADYAHFEMHLGEIAVEQKQYEDALQHFQHFAGYQPDSAESWASLAMVYRMLENYEEAEARYKQAIELEPFNEDYYYILSEMFATNKQPEKAIELLEDGLMNNPDSAMLHMFLALRYLDTSDYRQAEIFIQKAERLDPGVPMGQMMHQVIDLMKLEGVPGSSKSTPKLSMPEKKKRSR